MSNLLPRRNCCDNCNQNLDARGIKEEKSDAGEDCKYDIKIKIEKFDDYDVCKKEEKFKVEKDEFPVKRYPRYSPRSKRQKMN